MNEAKQGKIVKSKDSNIAHIRINRPQEGDRNYDETLEIFNFLKEEGDLPFDAPFNARPKPGEKALRDRAMYLMVEGLMQLKKMYPKHSKTAHDLKPIQGARRDTTEEAPF